MIYYKNIKNRLFTSPSPLPVSPFTAMVTKILQFQFFNGNRMDRLNYPEWKQRHQQAIESLSGKSVR
jgi:hypothetical protein